MSEQTQLTEEECLALNKRIFELREGVPITWIEDEGDWYAYRNGLDELDGAAWDYIGSGHNDYASDLNAAWELFATLPDDYTPRLVRMIVPRGLIVFRYKAGIIRNVHDDEWETLDANPALAICYTWMAWKEAQPASESAGDDR